MGVKNRLPGRAVVDRLPYAAGRKAHVDHVRIAFDGDDVVNAPAHAGRPYRTPAETLQNRVIGLIDRRGRGAGLLSSLWGLLGLLGLRRKIRDAVKRQA